MSSSSSIFSFSLVLILLLHVQPSSPFSLSVENHQDDIILSPNRAFTAGFYPVGENAYCFAIWFTQQHRQSATVVWIANRDQPVNGKRSSLSLLKTGNLILTDADQFTVWSTSTASLNSPDVELLDTGNLVLRDRRRNETSSILWQSFDFPTDTLLPEQSLTRHMKLVSARSAGNFSSGFYQLFFDDDNILRLLYEGPRISSVYWPDPWLVSNSGGRTTYNSTRVAKLDPLGRFHSSDNFTMKACDYGTVLQRRVTLDHDGNVRVYSRNDGESEWSVSAQIQQEPCFIHGICGPNSICSYDTRSGRKCSCIPGYSWINNQDWTQGCKPNFQRSCNRSEADYQIQFIPHVDFYGYDLGSYPNHTYQQCVDLCLGLCECIGFQHTFAIENGLFWCYPKTQLLNGHRSESFIGSFFVPLPRSTDNSLNERNSLVCSGNVAAEQLERAYVKGKDNGSVKFVLWFASGIGGFELVCFLLVWCFLFRDSGGDEQGYVLAAATGFQRFGYSELKKATKGFSQEIGRGAGGTVYKGVLSDNRVAAIKVLHAANQGESEFLAEVGFIGRLNHMNLIGMWGYCAEGKHRILVYEYMENGTLAKNLSSNALDWSKRYNIALGTARGLAYLHEECLEWILHCDIKPQNILLDANYQPTVADFGLSKLLQRDDLNNSSFSRIRGTRGYMAPEWVFNLPITSKVDVYSYGIVVLEMITGKSPMTGIIQILEGAEPHHERLVTWVREKKRSGAKGASWVEQVVDPALGKNYDMNKMEILATVALECVAEDKDMRPSMSQVYQRLQAGS
ncbi:putative receptor protein kinase ZmPK1 [Lotus japonicus]|uniref:putative receptor protein kinase ZmPK1 n=1 Tax=Lotus japonicus TaxID=34305 RepID=UPI00258AE141|nr:putative receptor protein kinase ZmPK1 [Lotus japonicus]